MITPIIMCGGVGSRLWPLSRSLKPKQFQKIYSDLSIFQETLKRFEDKNIFSDPLILCSESDKFYVTDQAKEINVKLKKVLCEPALRNTSPAITLVSMYLESIDDSNMVIVVSSDQYIHPLKAYISSLKLLNRTYTQESINIFGVSAKSPNTGYGYIKLGKKILENKIYEVNKFIEKPNLNSAKRLISSGGYMWNVGMFAFKPQIMITAVRLIDPQTYTQCKKILQNTVSDKKFISFPLDQYQELYSASIDKRIIENLGSYGIPLRLIKLDINWSDIGSWSSIYDLLKTRYIKKSKNSNIELGDVVSSNTKNSFLHSESKLLATYGVDDLIVVQTDDATLVAKKSNSEGIKELFKELLLKKRSEIISHKNVDRPWGSFESLKEEQSYHAKKLVIKPNAKLSLQSHKFRSEHWIVVDGKTKVIRGDDEFLLKKNDYIFIPKTVKHTIHNPFSKPCSIVEVQTGTYFGEDDIKRYEDIYGRV